MSPRRLLGAVLCCLILFSATACSDTNGTGGTEYVSGDGRWIIVPAADRGEPVKVQGEDLDGHPLNLDDVRQPGKATVINVWWSGCPPCRAEQPDLNEVAAQTADKAVFVGINTRDNSSAMAQSFVREFKVTYPSFFDPSGQTLLGFSGAITPRSMPATLVLDPEGRVAASIFGAVPSKITLADMIDDAVGTSSKAANG